VIDFKENIVVKSFKISDFCLSCVQALKEDEIFAVISNFFKKRLEVGITKFIFSI
jgi:hypothetical protein